ncbi:MAG: hypothetical protein DYH17_10675 [Xanthomonadales bacterium PRO6]|nr:hypothetical protein [Xanthomonadales bacterium PRO6]
MQFSAAGYSRSESSPPLTATVTLSNPVQSGVTLTVFSSAGTATATDRNLLGRLFRHGFEDAPVNAAVGSARMPPLSALRDLDAVARLAFVLDDAEGEAARVYVRLFDGRLQCALALRAPTGRLRLGAWQDRASEPTLHWSAAPGEHGWRLLQAGLR